MQIASGPESASAQGVKQRRTEESEEDASEGRQTSQSEATGSAEEEMEAASAEHPGSKQQVQREEEAPQQHVWQPAQQGLAAPVQQDPSQLLAALDVLKDRIPAAVLCAQAVQRIAGLPLPPTVNVRQLQDMSAQDLLATATIMLSLHATHIEAVADVVRSTGSVLQQAEMPARVEEALSNAVERRQQHPAAAARHQGDPHAVASVQQSALAESETPVAARAGAETPVAVQVEQHPARDNPAPLAAQAQQQQSGRVGSAVTAAGAAHADAGTSNAAREQQQRVELRKERTRQQQVEHAGSVTGAAAAGHADAGTASAAPEQQQQSGHDGGSPVKPAGQQERAGPGKVPSEEEERLVSECESEKEDTEREATAKGHAVQQGREQQQTANTSSSGQKGVSCRRPEAEAKRAAAGYASRGASAGARGVTAHSGAEHSSSYSAGQPRAGLQPAHRSGSEGVHSGDEQLRGGSQQRHSGRKQKRAVDPTREGSEQQPLSKLAAEGASPRRHSKKPRQPAAAAAAPARQESRHELVPSPAVVLRATGSATEARREQSRDRSRSRSRDRYRGRQHEERSHSPGRQQREVRERDHADAARCQPSLQNRARAFVQTGAASGDYFPGHQHGPQYGGRSDTSRRPVSERPWPAEERIGYRGGFPGGGPPAQRFESRPWTGGEILASLQGPSRHSAGQGAVFLPDEEVVRRLQSMSPERQQAVFRALGQGPRR